jgi:hypothetical protein
MKWGVVDLSKKKFFFGEMAIKGDVGRFRFSRKHLPTPPQNPTLFLVMARWKQTARASVKLNPNYRHEKKAKLMASCLSNEQMDEHKKNNTVVWMDYVCVQYMGVYIQMHEWDTMRTRVRVKDVMKEEEKEKENSDEEDGMKEEEKEKENSDEEDGMKEEEKEKENSDEEDGMKEEEKDAAVVVISDGEDEVMKEKENSDEEDGMKEKEEEKENSDEEDAVVVVVADEEEDVVGVVIAKEEEKEEEVVSEKKRKDVVVGWWKENHCESNGWKNNKFYVKYFGDRTKTKERNAKLEDLYEIFRKTHGEEKVVTKREFITYVNEFVKEWNKVFTNSPIYKSRNKPWGSNRMKKRVN